MSELLNFLNAASPSTLTKIPALKSSTANKIVAARPFASVEDALKVEGVDEALLSEIKSFVEGQDKASGNSAISPVEEEATPAPISKKPPGRKPLPEGDSFFSRFGRAFVNFLRALLRLILTAVLIAAVGAALYYGLPYLQRTFIAPVERNAAEIRDMKAEIAALQTQLEEMTTRVGALESSIESHTAALEKLEAMQTALEAELQANDNEALTALRREVMFARAFDILGRARLYLAQSNFGLAKTDVQSARDLLAELQAEKNDPALAQAIARLDLTLGNLPEFPVVASGDLEIAWQILLSGEAPPTPTPEPTGTPTPLPEPTAEATPTAAP